MTIKQLPCKNCIHEEICKNKEENQSIIKEIETMKHRDGNIYTEINADIEINVYCKHFYDKSNNAVSFAR